jgi:hypothetical protein
MEFEGTHFYSKHRPNTVIVSPGLYMYHFTRDGLTLVQVTETEGDNWIAIDSIKYSKFAVYGTNSENITVEGIL